jgi:hypothetical protein
MSIFGLVLLFWTLNLHKIGNDHKPHKSHVIKFLIVNLIINQYKTSRKIHKNTLYRSMYSPDFLLTFPTGLEKNKEVVNLLKYPLHSFPSRLTTSSASPSPGGRAAASSSRRAQLARFVSS